MTIEFQHSPSPPPAPPELGPRIDTARRYDVYCYEPPRGIVVYRNALFKGTGYLLPSAGGRTIHHDFVELEQANGQPIFITRNSIFRFCAPGTALVAEVVMQKGPNER